MFKQRKTGFQLALMSKENGSSRPTDTLALRRRVGGLNSASLALPLDPLAMKVVFIEVNSPGTDAFHEEDHNIVSETLRKQSWPAELGLER
jgi:hypothetical protein